MTCRIDAMIVGAEKAGTTSLGAYVSEHPKVLSHLGPDSTARQMEFPAFVGGHADDSVAFRRMFLEAFGREPRQEETVVGKSVGILHQSEASRALYRHNPECRLVAILRNPVDRAYSSYWYQRYRGTEDADSFEGALESERRRADEGIDAPDRMYLAKGHYAEHLQGLAERFGRDRLHVLLLDDLKERPARAVGDVFTFLGLESVELDELLARNTAKRARWPGLARATQREGLLRDAFRALVPRRGRRLLWGWMRRLNTLETRPPPMDDATRGRLVEYFRPHNRRLEPFLERDLEHWNR